MIHFELKKEMSSNTIILSNETTLKSQKSVKWLKIHIDKKLNFKEHVKKRVANATKALHSISRLQNTEWGLSSMTSRQLYMTCISAISDYDSEIWWKNQKQFRNKLQKLQNAALKKILEAFRISSIVVMKIETNLKSINIRLDQKNKKLELRMLKMKKNHSIRLKISNFSLKNWKKRNVKRAFKRIFKLKSRRITRNAINKNDAFNFQIHHRWILDRRNDNDKKYLKKFIIKNWNWFRRRRSKQSFKESRVNSSN
jgi:hypothetical protein